MSRRRRNVCVVFIFGDFNNGNSFEILSLDLGNFDKQFVASISKFNYIYMLLFLSELGL